MSTVFIFLTRIFILLFPLLYLPSIFNPYETPKFVALLVGSYITALLYLIKILNHNIQSTFKLDRITFLILLLVFITVFADIFGLDPKTSILGSKWRYQGLLTLVSGVGIYLIIRFNPVFVNKLNILKTIVLANCFMSLYSLYEVIQIHFFNSPILTYNGRIVATMGNPNYLAGFLAMTLPFVLGISFTANKTLSFLLKTAIVTLNIYIIIQTDSRAGMIAVIAVVVLYLIWYLYGLKIIFISLITTALLLVGVNTALDYAKNINLLNSRGSNWDSRSVIWTEGINSIRRRLAIGYGQENYTHISYLTQVRHIDNAHNIFIETVIATGVIGLIIYLLVLFEIFKKISFIYALALFSFLIRAQFNPLSLTEILYFWIIVGLAENEKRLVRLKDFGNHSKSNHPSKKG